MFVSTLQTTVQQIVDELKCDYSISIELNNEKIALRENNRMRSASVIKLPVLIEGFRQIDQGECHEGVMIDYTESEKVGGMGVLSQMDSIHSLSLLDVMTLMIIVSDNTASNLSIRQLGFKQINDLSRTLHCSQTELTRYFFDYEAAKRGLDNYTCAADMVKFLKEVTDGELLSQKSKKRILDILKKQQFNTKLPGRLKSVAMAHKTGEIPGVEHDVGIMELGNNKAFVAVLLSNLEDNRKGQEAIARIGEEIYVCLNRVKTGMES